ncbi:Uncharacterized protein PBTT_07826 [Plasmodiophora brassicae]
MVYSRLKVGGEELAVLRVAADTATDTLIDIETSLDAASADAELVYALFIAADAPLAVNLPHTHFDGAGRLRLDRDERPVAAQECRRGVPAHEARQLRALPADQGA